jgi:hypothetical protein
VMCKEFPLASYLQKIHLKFRTPFFVIWHEMCLSTVHKLNCLSNLCRLCITFSLLRFLSIKHYLHCRTIVHGVNIGHENLGSPIHQKQ